MRPDHKAFDDGRRSERPQRRGGLDGKERGMKWDGDDGEEMGKWALSSV